MKRIVRNQPDTHFELSFEGKQLYLKLAEDQKTLTAYRSGGHQRIAYDWNGAPSVQWCHEGYCRTRVTDPGADHYFYGSHPENLSDDDIARLGRFEWSDWRIPANDPILIQTVEQLGDEAVQCPGGVSVVE
jgi:hypothetical protein